MKKAVGLFLMCAGVFILLSDLLLILIGAVGLLAALVFLVIGVLSLYYGINWFKAPKPSKSMPATSGHRSQAPAPDPNLKKYKFNVAGISYRQAEMVEELGVYNDDYDMSKKQLLDEGLEDEKIEKYNFYILKVELVDDPENAYDPNAIKVVADGVHIGFVPKEKTRRVREILAFHPDAKLSCDVCGGDYKILEEDDDGNYSVEKVSLNYGAEVTVTYRETVAEDV